MTTRYLVDCDVEELDLAIPREHLQALVDYFDGRHDGERAVAEAISRGGELCFESRGGRLILELAGDAYRARDLDLIDDREGEFFEKVVVNLFRAYRGELRCRLRWAEARSGQREEWLDVVVERGHSTWPSGTAGAWLPRRPALPAPEPEPDAGAVALEEIAAKLEEAERYFAEYLRLKSQRGLAKG